MTDRWVTRSNLVRSCFLLPWRGEISAQGSSETRQWQSVLFLQEDGLKNLLETGASVNAPPDPQEQSPVHLAAGGGLACFLLWQLQTGADLNQQVTR